MSHSETPPAADVPHGFLPLTQQPAGLTVGSEAELWLFQLPRDISLSQLDGMKLKIQNTPTPGCRVGHVKDPESEDGEGRKSCVVIEGGREGLAQVWPVLPEGETSWIQGPRITRQFDVLRQREIPRRDVEPPKPKDPAVQPAGLRVRFHPSGWGSGAAPPPPLRSPPKAKKEKVHRKRKRSKQ